MLFSINKQNSFIFCLMTHAAAAYKKYCC